MLLLFFLESVMCTSNHYNIFRWLQLNHQWHIFSCCCFGMFSFVPSAEALFLIKTFSNKKKSNDKQREERELKISLKMPQFWRVKNIFTAIIHVIVRKREWYVFSVQNEISNILFDFFLIDNKKRFPFKQKKRNFQTIFFWKKHKI